MDSAQEAIFNANISRIAVVGEISPVTVRIPEGKTVKGFFIFQIILKKQKYDEKVILSLQKLIPQNMILLLQYEDSACLALCHKKLYHTEWQNSSEISLTLKGLDLDIVWANAVKDIVAKGEPIKWDFQKTADENIVAFEIRRKLEKNIAALEKKIRNEKQLNRQMQMKAELKRLINELGEL
jgi:hypothetical protein